jgi:hypothetical protein
MIRALPDRYAQLDAAPGKTPGRGALCSQLSMHIFVGSKAPWDHIGGSASQFAEWPPDLRETGQGAVISDSGPARE